MYGCGEREQAENPQLAMFIFRPPGLQKNQLIFPRNSERQSFPGKRLFAFGIVWKLPKFLSVLWRHELFL